MIKQFYERCQINVGRFGRKLDAIKNHICGSAKFDCAFDHN
jgi:hypothetical protein